MNKLKALGKTINDNRTVIIRRSLQGVALATGYFVANAVIEKLTKGDTLIVEGDAIVEVTSVD